MTMLEALEIFSNPMDLHIFITLGKNSDKYSIGIFRGPGHDFKPMITSNPFTKKPECAINIVREILEMALNVCTKRLEDPKDVLSKIVNPGGEKFDQSKVLTTKLIERILKDLEKRKVANTFEY